MEHPKQKGEIAEAQILAALLRHGEVVLLPFGDNQRYDLVVDRKGCFYRIQCKLGSLNAAQGVVSFNTCSTTAHTPAGGVKNYVGAIDFFGVYCPQNGECYLIPFADVAHVGRAANLRLVPSRNNQQKLTRLAETYRL